MSNTPKPVYVPHSEGGLNLVVSRGDGSTIAIEWDRAYPTTSNYSLMYNIYFSSTLDDVFEEGVKYVAQNDGYLNNCIMGLSPGETYYFAVRASQYETQWWNTALFIDAPEQQDLKLLAESSLLNNITDSNLSIEVSDIEIFPNYGIIQIGAELIRYTSRDLVTNTLIASERGFLNTEARLHTTDGYDGYFFRDPLVKFWKGFEDCNLKVFQETTNFSYPNAAFTVLDGYAVQEDNLTVDGSASDESLEDFPAYDGIGWRRRPLSLLVQGRCLGTYIGGEQFCADGYLGVGRQIRGIPLNERIARREEYLLQEATGELVVLVKRLWEGIRCPCVRHTVERGANRCLECFGTGFITGYEQFFNPRRSDGRILVQFGPAEEDIKFLDSGLENHLIYDCWTLGYPRLDDWDFIIRYDLEGAEEYRYELLNVTRNTPVLGHAGAQKFKAQRIRKTDPIYQWRAIDSTATIPNVINTSIGLLAGPNNTVLPHTHEIVINEGIVTLAQINQTTNVVQGHNHTIINGEIQDSLNHSHIIII